MNKHSKIHFPFKRENAQTMVEFALVFPLVLLIAFGLIEFGRMVFIYAAVTGAAREGSRYGAAAGDISGNMDPHYADCAGILNATHQGTILIPIQDDDITIKYDEGPGTAYITESCPPVDEYGVDAIDLGDRIIVHAVAHYQPIVSFLGFNGFDITSENARTILVNVDIAGEPPPQPDCEVYGGNIQFNVPDDEHFSWTLNNSGTNPVRMIHASINWPETVPTAKLQEIRIGVNTVWTGTGEPPTLNISEAGWSGAPNLRQLDPGASHTLSFGFSRIIPSGSYTVTLFYQDIVTLGTCSVFVTQTNP